MSYHAWPGPLQSMQRELKLRAATLRSTAAYTYTTCSMEQDSRKRGAAYCSLTGCAAQVVQETKLACKHHACAQLHVSCINMLW